MKIKDDFHYRRQRELLSKLLFQIMTVHTLKSHVEYNVGFGGAL